MTCAMNYNHYLCIIFILEVATLSDNPFVKPGEEVKEHPVKGGIQINDYLIYDW